MSKPSFAAVALVAAVSCPGAAAAAAVGGAGPQLAEGEGKAIA
jgi:hypothetical protein